MHPRRGPGREKHPSLATYRRHASKTSWVWQDMRAMYPKSPAIAFRECIARRSCQGGALFAARTPRIMHTAQILPSVAAEQRERRSFGVCAIRAPHSAEAWPRSRRHPPPQQRPEPPERSQLQRCLRPIDRLFSLSAAPRSYPLQLRLPWRSPSLRASPHCACILRFRQLRSAYKRQAEPLLRIYFAMVA